MARKDKRSEEQNAVIAKVQAKKTARRKKKKAENAKKKEQQAKGITVHA